MPQLVSTAKMIERLEGLLGTRDLDEREQEFVGNLAQIARAGQVTRLSDRQVEWLEDLHTRHFA